MPEEPQSILTPLTDAAIFLTVCVDPGGEDEVLDLLPDLGGLRRSVGFRAPDAGLSCVVGIGATLWERLFDAPLPPELHPFRELRGPVHTAPSTPGDLFFHIRASRLERARGLHDDIADFLLQRLPDAEVQHQPDPQFARRQVERFPVDVVGRQAHAVAAVRF